MGRIMRVIQMLLKPATWLYMLIPVSLTVNGQTVNDILVKKEIRLQKNFYDLRTARSDFEKQQISDSLLSSFRRLLTLPGSFNYSFDSLSFTGKIMAPDSAFRIINWNVPGSDGSHLYYMLIQVPDTSGSDVKVFTLTNSHAYNKIPESTLLDRDKWYGALYYDILENHTDTGNVYTLLGINYNDLFTTRKIIDILWFDNNHSPHFGAPVFIFPDHISYRVVFVFSAQVSMMLRYDRNLEMIVFDHLSPSKPAYKGIYQFYGPDFSYDGFIFRGGKWIFRQDLDLRNRNLSRLFD